MGSVLRLARHRGDDHRHACTVGDSPADRCKALLDASMALQSEHEHEGSVLQGRLDVSRRAVQGYSLGGGGAQLAALTDQTLKCVIALAPDEGYMFPSAHKLSFPSQPPTAVPVLILCGEKDAEAPPRSSHGRTTVRRALPS